MTTEKWFSPSTHMGWHKDMPVQKRRQVALKAHGRNKLSTARALQALANVTQDKATKKAALADAGHFYNLYRKEQTGRSKATKSKGKKKR